MKKTVSILLALTMLFAVCVPVFAAPSVPIVNPSDSGTVLVKTTTSTVPGGPDGSAESFIVAIPAATDITWGNDQAVDLSYNVESHLLRTHRMQVTVTTTNPLVDGKPAMKADGGPETLAYSLAGATAFTADKPILYTAAADAAGNHGVTQALSLTVDLADWNLAVVDTYRDTITYDISVVNA